MKQSVIRSLTGIGIISITVSLIWLPTVWRHLFWGSFLCLCLYEYFSLFKNRSDLRPYAHLGLTMAISLWGALLFPKFRQLGLSITLLLWFILIFQEIFRKENSNILHSALTTWGIAWLVPSFVAINLIYDIHGWEFFISLFIFLWMNDTFAFISGKLLGKHKLLKRVSPKKTWEGLFGGLLATWVVATVFVYFHPHLLPLWKWAVLSTLVVVGGTLGDLLESLIKRSLSLKDSGHVLPGHGGFLDRFDGFFISAPLFYLFLSL